MPKYLLNSKPRRKMVRMHLLDTPSIYSLRSVIPGVFSFFILAIILGGLEYRGGT
jgi:hypothetical protein